MRISSRLTRRTEIAVAAVSVTAFVTVTSLVNRGSPQSALAAETPRPDSSAVTFDNSGQLLRPEGYRRWVYVGTPLTPNDMNDGTAAFPEFHAVYVDPDTYEHFEETGEFRDGAVVIKELISVGARRATSGRGYFMGDFSGLEVAVKDETRFKDEPGNWAYFSFGHEYPLAESARPQPVANCSVCHGANADTDFVFTQYYPVLRPATDSQRSP